MWRVGVEGGVEGGCGGLVWRIGVQGCWERVVRGYAGLPGWRGCEDGRLEGSRRHQARGVVACVFVCTARVCTESSERWAGVWERTHAS